MARIEEPLRRYSERAKEVRRSLQEALAALKAKLAEKEALQAKRVALQVWWNCLSVTNSKDDQIGWFIANWATFGGSLWFFEKMK